MPEVPELPEVPEGRALVGDGDGGGGDFTPMLIGDESRKATHTHSKKGSLTVRRLETEIEQLKGELARYRRQQGALPLPLQGAWE